MMAGVEGTVIQVVRGAWMVLLSLNVVMQGARAEGVFDVTHYGAKGDGHTLDTEAVRSAFAECGK